MIKIKIEFCNDIKTLGIYIIMHTFQGFGTRYTVVASATHQKKTHCQAIQDKKRKLEKLSSIKQMHYSIESEVKHEIEYLKNICDIAKAALVNDCKNIDMFTTIDRFANETIYRDAAYGVYDEDEFKNDNRFMSNDVY